MVFHVLNRGVGRMRLFDDDDDYAAFERVLIETLEIQPMRVCVYCVMPNHWQNSKPCVVVCTAASLTAATIG